MMKLLTTHVLFIVETFVLLILSIDDDFYFCLALVSLK